LEGESARAAKARPVKGVSKSIGHLHLTVWNPDAGGSVIDNLVLLESDEADAHDLLMSQPGGSKPFGGRSQSLLLEWSNLLKEPAENSNMDTIDRKLNYASHVLKKNNLQRKKKQPFSNHSIRWTGFPHQSTRRTDLSPALASRELGYAQSISQ
jgi:hypothetical protein